MPVPAQHDLNSRNASPVQISGTISYQKNRAKAVGKGGNRKNTLAPLPGLVLKPHAACGFPGETLPPVDNYVAIARLNFDAVACAPELLGRHDC